MEQASQPAPIEVYYRRTHGNPTWVSFQGVHGFQAGRNETQNSTLGFRALSATESLDGLNGRFWGELILVRRYAASNDVNYYPKAELRCHPLETGGFDVETILYASRLPDAPREMRGWTGAHPTHLSYTAKHATLPRAIDLFMAFPRPDADPSLAPPPVIPRDTAGKPIILGRAGAAPRPTPTPSTTKKPNG